MKRTLTDRAREFLAAPALQGLGEHDRTVVLAIAAGMASAVSGDTPDVLRGSLVAGRHIADVRHNEGVREAR